MVRAGLATHRPSLHRGRSGHPVRGVPAGRPAALRRHRVRGVRRADAHRATSRTSRAAANQRPRPGAVPLRLAYHVERQQVLAGEDPPKYVAVVHEAAVRMHFGGRKVTRAQLEHLLTALSRVMRHLMDGITWEEPFCGEGASCFRLGTDPAGHAYIAIAGQEENRLTDTRDALRALILGIKDGKADHLL
nr:Scr1 family TA system antitoxin-like transcriptional regulator [Streptomyces actuosus]